MSNNYVIFTDNSSDLTPEQCQKHNLRCLNLEVIVNGRPFAAGHSLEEFYQAMTPQKPATTSAVNIYTFEQAFREVLLEGKDILYLGIHHTLSGTYNNSCVAARTLLEEFPDRRIECVETFSVAPGLGLLARMTEAVRQKGYTLDETIEFVKEQRGRIAHRFSIDEFDYLKAGGRISNVKAAIASTFKIYPILHFNADGYLADTGIKAHGIQPMLKKLAELACRDCTENTFIIAHGSNPKKAENLEKYILSIRPDAEIEQTRIGPVIGTHVGPSVIAVFFISDKR